MRTFHRMRRSVATVLLAVHLPACHYWAEPNGLTPQQYVDRERPAEARVTLTDSSTVLLQRPWVSSDTLWGGSASGLLRGVPLSSVQHIQVRESDGTATVFLVVGLVALAVVGAGVALAASGWDPGIGGWGP
jgi:hypothetical protein